MAHLNSRVSFEHRHHIKTGHLQLLADVGYLRNESCLPSLPLKQNWLTKSFALQSC